MRRTLASPILAISSKRPEAIRAEVLSASIKTARRGARVSKAMPSLTRPAWCRSLPIRRDLHRHDLVGVGDHPVLAGAALDLVDGLHAFGHLAPDRVLPVEEGSVGKADEELA